MSGKYFHESPFDEGTLTKLQIFELYAREWLPVFLHQSWVREIHVFDFFAGPGLDPAGNLGSPLRVLKQLKEYQGLPGWRDGLVHAHFFDIDSKKIDLLKRHVGERGLAVPGVMLDIEALAFAEAFSRSDWILSGPATAKLLFIDQCGVDHVDEAVFRRIVSSPRCDFLFFLSSSTLNRFRDHPAIKLKIERPDDSYHVHRAALEYYRGLLPSSDYYLAPFSLKKGPNIYGLIFGSAHPLGIDKFLQVAWSQDAINGEADFDINRENLQPDQMTLDFGLPRKLSAFEQVLESHLRAGHIKDELGVVRICFDHGVRRQHAKPVLARLKKDGVTAADFQVPSFERSDPRPIQLLSKPKAQ